MSLHTFAAMAAKAPELELEPAEAKRLAEATEGVARHYINLPTGQTADWINLFMALGFVYGTRLLAINNRLKAQSQRPAPSLVVDNGDAGPYAAN